MKGGLSPKHTPELGNEAPAVNESEGPKILKITIPADLYVEYEVAAGKSGLTVAELVLHRLRRCKDHNGIRTLFFSDAQRAQLENILQKKPLETSEQALTVLKACLSVNLSDFEPVPLTAQQVKRLAMAGYAGQTPQDRVRQIVQNAVSKAVGI